MIFITGDCHATFNRFSTKMFPVQKEMSKDDFVIICGDFGGVWQDTPEERYWLDWLNDKPFTTLFVDGNHENFDRLCSDEFESTHFNGGIAGKIRSSIYHLRRGHIFLLDGKRFFAFGGARSHDISDGILDRADFETDRAYLDTYHSWRLNQKDFRINHLSWWRQELPSDGEMELGRKNLANSNNEVDFVVSHCLPQSIASVYSNGRYKPDPLTVYLQSILESNLIFKKWYCGHYHDNASVMGKFQILYENIIRIV